MIKNLPISCSGSANLPIGTAFIVWAYTSGYCSLHFSKPSVIANGHTTFMFMPSGPHSVAATRLKPLIPSFATMLGSSRLSRKSSSRSKINYWTFSILQIRICLSHIKEGGIKTWHNSQIKIFLWMIF